MPKYLAGPGGVAQGELTVPGDKSISHRSLMLGGIADGVTDITGFLAEAGYVLEPGTTNTVWVRRRN